MTENNNMAAGLVEALCLLGIFTVTAFATGTHTHHMSAAVMAYTAEGVFNLEVYGMKNLKFFLQMYSFK